MELDFSTQEKINTSNMTRQEIIDSKLPEAFKLVALKEFDDKLEFALLKTVEEKVDWLAKKLNYA